MTKSNKLFRILTVMISVLLIGGFLYGENKKGFSGFEFSIGGAFPSFDELGYKHDKIKGEADDLISFYESVGWKGSWDSSSGELKNIGYMIPVNIAAIFNLNNRLSVKVGMELSFGDKGSLLRHKAGDEDNDISLDLKTKSEISCFMPFVGLDYKFGKKFSLYSTIGLGLAHLKYLETYDLKNGSDIYYMNKSEYSGNGTGIGIVFGGKFYIRKDLFLKIEYVFYKTGISGDLKWSEDSWKDGSISGKVSGDFYTYENHYPYSEAWVKDWTVFASSSPAGVDKRNLNTMELNFSSIRISLGFYF